MRFISEDDRSMQCLNAWSAQSPLKVVTFYFWNAGVVEQRSQTGLLRSLLYGILSKQNDLVQLVFPKEWREAYNDISINVESSKIHQQPWSLFKLKKAFAELIKQARSQFRICFFLDGLDEYDGDHAELASFFHDLSSGNDHLKLCLSSRPWPVFDDIFEYSPGLKLQDLTHLDIKLYVEDHLSKNKMMRQLQEEEPLNAAEIIEEITQKACGVFLWVKLVVKSLVAGLTNHDDVSRLRERLEALPAELENLYEHMLNSVDKIYRRDASRIFQMVRFRLECPIKHRPFGIPDLYQALAANFNSTMATEIRETDRSIEEVLKLYRHYERLETSLKVSCKGLLEVPPTAQAAAVKKAATISFPPITYMHRTVRDYLDQPEVFQKLVAHTAGTETEPQLALLMTTIEELKESRPDDSFNWSLAMHALDILKRLGQGDNNIKIALAEEFDRVMSHHWLNGLKSLEAKSSKLLYYPMLNLLHWTRSPELQTRRMTCEAWGNGLDFLRFAVANNLAYYVDAKISLDNSLLKIGHKPPLLALALGWNHGLGPSALDHYLPRIRTLELLLNRGAIPDEPYQGHTIWKHIVYYLHSDHKRWSKIPGYYAGPCSAWQHVVKLMLQHDADPHVCCFSKSTVWEPTLWYHPSYLYEANHCSLDGRDHSLKTIITDVFGKNFPEGAIELLQLFEEKKTKSAMKN